MKLLVIIFSLLILTTLSQTDEECGKREAPTSRIIGGEVSKSGNWPWMAAIYFTHGGNREFDCGGSLVGAQHILTAAHCFYDDEQNLMSGDMFTVILGDVDLKRKDEPSAPETFKVVEVHVHNFDHDQFYNDIAVLVLDHAPKRSRYVIPICLPPPSAQSNTFEGQNAIIVGWGATRENGKMSPVQRELELPVWNNEDCKNAFKPHYKIISSEMCAGYSKAKKGVCEWDSGGPLMIESDGHWIQIGIVSYGPLCGKSGYPGVYTRVTEYLDWIKQKIQ